MVTYESAVEEHKRTAVESSLTTVTFGPCWCRGVPGSDGSFDVFRHRSVRTGMGRSILVVSERVPPNGVSIVRRLRDSLDDPLVVETSACPAAGWYWERSPSGWTEVSDLVPIDHRIDACLTGQPETLFAELLPLLRYPSNSAVVAADHARGA